MTASDVEGPSVTGDRGRTPFGGWLRLVRQRVRERAFWIVQLLVFTVTALHVAAEAYHLDDAEPLSGLIELVVVLHIIPVVYAGFRYGYEGSVLTGLWSGVLAIPNVMFWHSEDFHWINDLTFIFFVILVGVVIAVPVERERRQRQRLQAYAQAVMVAQEQERARIARDLHDVVAQELVRLTRRLDDLDDVGARAGDVRALAEEILDNVRRVSRDLRPTILEDLGLMPAMKMLTEELHERTGIQTHVELTGEPYRLSNDRELTLYRIVQEALHNAERHAAPDTVTVTADFRPEEVLIEVEDDGSGFDPVDAAAGQRLGILGMQERADLVGGTLGVTTAPRWGTRITARIPASEEALDG